MFFCIRYTMRTRYPLDPPPKVTRREVHIWLSNIESEIGDILRAPADKLHARLVALQRCVGRWRDRLGVKR
jgi:hypothetical protein